MAEILIAENDAIVQITATGGQTVFNYDFPIFDEDHIVVKKTQASDGVTSTLVLTTDYTVEDVGEESGGTITLTSGATDNDVYTLLRDTPEERLTDFNQQGDFFASSLNREFDLIAQWSQQLRRDVDKSVRFSDEETSTASTLLPSPEANKTLVWNSGATALENSDAELNNIVTEAEAARDAAQLAETGAETAETNAELAETNAETAQAAAEQAQADAEAALGIVAKVDTVSPAVTDDDAAGFPIGSHWINTTDDKAFISVDATNGAAVWIETTAVGASTLDLALIRDTNSNESLSIIATASAVNFYEVINSATGNGVTLSAVGDDANVDNILDAKGTGKINFKQAAFGTAVTLADGANIATDSSLSNKFRVTLAGNRTLDAPTGSPDDMQTILYKLIQDPTGNRTITLDTGAGGFRFGDDIPSVTLGTTANEHDLLGVVYDVTDNKWDVALFQKGF